jgi:hypothetical protein
LKEGTLRRVSKSSVDDCVTAYMNAGLAYKRAAQQKDGSAGDLNAAE